MAPPPRRGMGPLVAVIVVVVLVIVAALAYAGIGYAYAQGQENSARDTYNSVISDVNSYTDTVNALSSITNTNAFSTTDLQKAKAQFTDLVTKAQALPDKLDADKTKLQGADSSLKQNSWLTLAGKSGLDRWSTKIGHLEKALDAAKVLAADDVQIGNFLTSVVDVVQDLDTMTTKAQAQDLAGTQAAIAKLKTDAAKAITQDKAPGLPAEADTFLKDIQLLADDFNAVITSAAMGDQAAYSTALTKLNTDLKSLQAVNTDNIDTALSAYYKPLIDAYNSEINAANNA